MGVLSESSRLMKVGVAAADWIMGDLSSDG